MTTGMIFSYYLYHTTAHNDHDFQRSSIVLRENGIIVYLAGLLTGWLSGWLTGWLSGWLFKRVHVYSVCVAGFDFWGLESY